MSGAFISVFHSVQNIPQIATSDLRYAFLASGLTIIAVVFTGVIGLFPNLIPSSLDPAQSLTIFNTSSSPLTLRVMTVVAFIFVPIIVVYQLLVYRFFRKPVTAESLEGELEGY